MRARAQRSSRPVHRGLVDVVAIDASAAALVARPSACP